MNASPLHHAAAEGHVELMEMIINDSSFEGHGMLQWVLYKSIIPLDSLGRVVWSNFEGQMSSRL